MEEARVRQLQDVPIVEVPDVVPRRRSMPSSILRAMRPLQWPKNFLVFAAAGAAGVLGHPPIVWRASLAFVAFCVIASATYLVNDVLDARFDRLHPLKRFRPVASGELSTRTALVVSGLLLALGGVASGVLGPRFVVVVAVYVAMSITYSLRLKRVAVLEMTAVASGFVLRAVAGSAATGVPPSAWFLILACSGAMFVVAGKRLADARATTSEEDRTSDRPPYPVEFLRGAWVLAGGVTVTAYCLWAFAVPHTVDGIAWSQVSIVPFAIAIFRYAYSIELGGAGAPERLFLHDHVLEALTIAWVVVYALGVYLR
ncbi:MAG: decaprenyl-phosphate phosphoribosyltransferase [Actinomycetota bacterium]